MLQHLGDVEAQFVCTQAAYNTHKENLYIQYVHIAMQGHTSFAEHIYVHMFLKQRIYLPVLTDQI